MTWFCVWHWQLKKMNDITIDKDITWDFILINPYRLHTYNLIYLLLFKHVVGNGNLESDTFPLVFYEKTNILDYFLFTWMISFVCFSNNFWMNCIYSNSNILYIVKVADFDLQFISTSNKTHSNIIIDIFPDIFL